MEFSNEVIVLVGALSSIIVQALRLLASRFNYYPGDQLVAVFMLALAAVFGVWIEGIPIGDIFSPDLFQGYISIFGSTVAVYMLFLKNVLRRPVEE